MFINEHLNGPSSLHHLGAFVYLKLFFGEDTLNLNLTTKVELNEKVHV